MVELPRGAEILSAGWRCAAPVAWALVDPYAIVTPRMLVLMPTNAQCDFANEMPIFVGRIDLPGSDQVFHLFDLGEKPITPFREGAQES